MRTMYVLLLFVGGAVADDAKPRKWDFEDATVEKLPKGWTAAKTGDGEGSVWKVVEGLMTDSGVVRAKG